MAKQAHTLLFKTGLLPGFFMQTVRTLFSDP
jgi:hypothetical protein